MTAAQTFTALAVSVWIVMTVVTWDVFGRWHPRRRNAEWWRTFNRCWMCLIWPLTLVVVLVAVRREQQTPEG